MKLVMDPETLRALDNVLEYLFKKDLNKLSGRDAQKSAILNDALKVNGWMLRGELLHGERV